MRKAKQSYADYESTDELGYTRVVPITKTRLFKQTENFTSKKNENFQIKKSDIFHISAQNIDYGDSLEPPRRGGSNESP